jgi:hypothetical protein
MPVPAFGLGGYRHDVGVVWLSLAARDGSFGNLKRFLSAREMAALDQSGGSAEVLGVEPPRSFGASVRGSEQTVFPDLGLVLGDWGWVALFLQLTVPARSELAWLLRWYGADRLARWMLFLADDRPGRAQCDVGTGEHETERLQRDQSLGWEP